MKFIAFLIQLRRYRKAAKAMAKLTPGTAEWWDARADRDIQEDELTYRAEHF